MSYKTQLLTGGDRCVIGGYKVLTRCEGRREDTGQGVPSNQDESGKASEKSTSLLQVLIRTSGHSCSVREVGHDQDLSREQTELTRSYRRELECPESWSGFPWIDVSYMRGKRSPG